MAIGGFICVFPLYLEWEIAAGADVHKRLTVMRVHVNQAVVCKDKTKDKLFKKTSGLLRKLGGRVGVSPRSNFHAEQIKVTRRSRFHCWACEHQICLPEGCCFLISTRVDSIPHNHMHKHILYAAVGRGGVLLGGLSFNFCGGGLPLQTRNYVAAFACDECGGERRGGSRNVSLVSETSLCGRVSNWLKCKCVNIDCRDVQLKVPPGC